MTDARKTVGLIGLGLIGTALARRLIAAGFEVVGHDVDAARCAQLSEMGGRAESSIAQLAGACRRIIVAVFDTDQVEEVIEAAGGVLSAMAATPGARMVLNVTTSDPERIAALAVRVAPRGLTLIEVPLSGTSQQVLHGDGVGLIAGDAAACE